MDVVKPREYPLSLDSLDALAFRLFDGHRKQDEISEDRSMILAGYRGEQSVDYYLNFVTADGVLIFHGLRIPWQNGLYFQIDTLIVTLAYIVVMEVKNMAGTLYFDQPAEQLIRTRDGVEDGFAYPPNQAKRQAFQLEMFLRQHGFPPIPIIPMVVISRPPTIITTNQDDTELFGQVMHAANLPSKLHALGDQHSQKCFHDSHIDRLSNLLLQNHTPLIPNYMKKFAIEKHELHPGVVCSHCKQLTMVRDYGCWKCTRCGDRNKDAHIRALLDYFLLIGANITNRQFREFTGLESVYLASRLLSALRLPTTGSKKNRGYVLHFNELRDALN